MKPTPAHYSQLSGREQKIAHLAAIARHDTLMGGARAMVIAKNRNNAEDIAIVSEVYRASTGGHHEVYEAWECPECGQACLGRNEAYSCCEDR